MRPGLRTKLRALGPELTPAMIQGTSTLLADIAAPRDPSIEVTRDHRYGPDPRHRLDVFRRGAPADAPVLVYVHGGGYVMGDKITAGSPFYDNVGQWAAHQGWIGVTLTYRLAPASRWPGGPQDMAHAVRWLREHIASHGGDPAQIILMGQSAGGAHVAAYLAQSHVHDQRSAGLAGAVMISGIYDSLTQPANQFSDAYFGAGPALRTEAQCIAGLLVSPVPLLFTVSEFDPRDFQDQAAQLARAWHERKGCYAPLEYLAGHNHISPALSLGSAEGQLAARVAEFVATISAG